MRKLVVLLVFGLAISAQAQLKAHWDGNNTPSKKFMEKILAAWSHGGAAEGAVFYDKSPEDVFYDVAPLKYQGFAEYQKGVEDAFQSIKLTLGDDAKVHMAGNTAWATATFSAQGKLKNGNGISEQGRWTVIWQKKGPKWLIVHEHVSFPWTLPTERRQR